MVKVGEYNNPIDAEIAKSQLESYDIPCFLFNKNTSSLYPDLGIVPVTVFVSEQDAKKASEILNQSNLE